MRCWITYTFEKPAGRSATDRFHEAVGEIRLGRREAALDCPHLTAEQVMPGFVY